MPQNKIKYKCFHIEDAAKKGLDIAGFEPDDFGNILYRIENGIYHFVGSDRTEPEDKTLIRDFAWMVDELNRLANEYNNLLSKEDTMITVTYSDGMEREYLILADAELDITELVIGSNFGITVDNIESNDGKNYGASFSVKLEEI